MAWPTDSLKNPYGSEPIPIRACTFEAPRVGNHLYSEAFTDMQKAPGLSMVRIVNKGDLVPEVRQLQCSTASVPMVWLVDGTLMAQVWPLPGHCISINDVATADAALWRRYGHSFDTASASMDWQA